MHANLRPHHPKPTPPTPSPLLKPNLNLHLTHTDFSDFDLPLKQLQYTRTRKYKQNLNPIFQQLQTTHNRYSYSKEWRNQNDCVTLDKCEGLEGCDRFQVGLERGKRKDKVKVEELIRERSRIMGGESPNNMGQKGQLFSFGELVLDNLSKKEDKQKKKTSAESFSNRQQAIHNQRVVPQRDRVKSRHRQSIAKVIVEQPQRDDDDESRFFRIFDHKKAQLSNKNEYIPTQQQSQEQLTSQELAQKFLQTLQLSLQSLSATLQQRQNRLTLLTSQLSMHKQKTLLQQRQLYHLTHQATTLSLHSTHLQSLLSAQAHQHTTTETHFTHNSRTLRQKKKELKKEQAWLMEENEEIVGLERRFEELLGRLREVEEEGERREEQRREWGEEVERREGLRAEVERVGERVGELVGEVQVVEEETRTLEMHEQQLVDLEHKFKRQTEALMQTIAQLNQQIQQKHQSISQEHQIQQISKDLQLEMGQISEKKLIIQQEIHEINVKISLKKRNIRHIHKRNREEMGEGDQRVGSRKMIEMAQIERLNRDRSMDRSAQQRQRQPHQKPPSLPTIRQQQSKNTSAYQSPYQNPSSPPAQKTPRQQPQPTFHAHQSSSLQLDSHMVSRTQIMRAHDDQKQLEGGEHNNDRKKKKYFIIESEDDSRYHGGEVGDGKEREGRLVNWEIYDNNRSDELFIERQKKPSIEHRLYDVADLRLGTDHHCTEEEEENYYRENDRENVEEKLFGIGFQQAKEENLIDFKQRERQLKQEVNSYKINPIHQNPKTRSKSPSTRLIPLEPRKSPPAKKFSPSRPNFNKRQNSSQASSNRGEDEVFESLISQYEQIKSNSCFEEAWKRGM